MSCLSDDLINSETTEVVVPTRATRHLRGEKKKNHPVCRLNPRSDEVHKDRSDAKEKKKRNTNTSGTKNGTTLPKKKITQFLTQSAPRFRVSFDAGETRFAPWWFGTIANR